LVGPREHVLLAAHRWCSGGPAAVVYVCVSSTTAVWHRHEVRGFGRYTSWVLPMSSLLSHALCGCECKNLHAAVATVVQALGGFMHDLARPGLTGVSYRSMQQVACKASVRYITYAAEVRRTAASMWCKCHDLQTYSNLLSFALARHPVVGHPLKCYYSWYVLHSWQATPTK
jgi:hypothetical protein